MASIDWHLGAAVDHGFWWNRRTAHLPRSAISERRQLDIDNAQTIKIDLFTENQ